MKTTENKTIILLGKYSMWPKELWTALNILKVPHTIKFFSGISPLTAYLENTEQQAVLFLLMTETTKNNLAKLTTRLEHYPNLSIAVYDPNGLVKNVEDVFAVGANIYIHQPFNQVELNNRIRQVMKIDTLFASGSFNRETFFLSA